MYAVSLGVTVLIILLVLRLNPLGGGAESSGSQQQQPPDWLVRVAYQKAYQSGDIAPTSAEWVRSNASVIAPAVGLRTGDSNVQEYLVVLHGHFTAYAASVPYGAALPTGSVLSFAIEVSPQHRITDWGVGDRKVPIPGLEPFVLPDGSQTYTDPAGWTVPVPPGWSWQGFDLSASPDTPTHGTMLANTSALNLVGPPAALPQASGAGFPDVGVALTVATTPHNFGGERIWNPPLSVDDMAQGSAPGGAPALSTLTFAGPDGQWYTMTLKVGSAASPLDRSAAASMVASLTFDQPPSTQVPISSAVPTMPQSATVPDLTGMTERQAEQALSDVGLAMLPNFSFSDSVPDGGVLTVSPAAGTEVSGATSVEVWIAAPGSPPANGGGWVWLGSLQREHPDLIVGAARGPGGDPVIALNPGVEAATAAPILDAALAGKPYSTISCQRSKSELDAVGKEIRGLSGSHRLMTHGWAGWVDALSCTYVVEGSFPASTVAEIQRRFGDRVSVVDGVRQSLDGGSSTPSP